jgi:DNA-binding PadR family transcriptional regulator
VITGSLQQAVLTVLFHTKREMTTQDIFRALDGKYKPLATASIFITLDRVGKKGLVALRKGDPRPERGGKARLHALITDKGRAEVLAVKERVEMLNTLSPPKAQGPQTQTQP